MRQLIVIGMMLLLPISCLLAQLTKITFQQPKMGSPFVITLYTNDSLKAKAAVERAFERVDELNSIFSDYSENSEISRLMQKPIHQWHTVSPDLMMVLKIAQNAAHLSAFSFDVTVGNIVKLWRKARKERKLPDKKAIQKGLEVTGFHNITLDTILSKIKFNKKGIQLDFGGIVKGYAAQQALHVLQKEGFQYVMVDAGGDLVVSEKPHEINKNIIDKRGDTWLIAISLPKMPDDVLSQYLSLKNKAVATSGDLYNFVELKGKRYSHIVNPKTGIGLTHQRYVTVIADDGATADWLATACSVLSIKKALRLVKKITNSEILILENKKGKIKQWQSRGFSKYFFAY